MSRTAVGTWLAVTLLSIWGAQAVLAQGDPATVAFHPQQDWHKQGPVETTSEGRVTLTEDGRGAVWKAVELNVDEFPVMLIRITNSLPRERWRLVVEQGEKPSFDQHRETVLLEKVGEEGGFMVPFQQTTGWHGKLKFVLMVVVEGRKGDRVVLENLEAIKLTTAPPARPKLCNPAPGASISPLALHFSWYQVADAVEYELQVSKTTEFSDAKSITVKPPYPADKLPYLPLDEELLPPGDWCWRVRGRNLAGLASEWSEPGAFTVKAAGSTRPPELAVTAEHPLVVLFGEGRRLAENWKAVPDELKPYTVLRIEEVASEQIRTVLQSAQVGRIPVILQTSGPHDYYGRTSSRIPLSEIEQLLVDYPIVKGVYICEQAFRVSPANNRIMMSYAERLIGLCAQYGKLMFWADGHWGRHLWIDVGLNQKLVEAMRRNRQYFVPIWKMNGPLTTYTAHDALFGLWIGEVVDNWGVQPERWYWYEAGFGKPNEQHWFKEGAMADFPPTFYGQMLLLGLSSGAAAYSLEPADDIWDNTGGLSEISRQVTFPVLQEIIRRRWIPSRAEVRPRIRSVYVAGDTDARWALDYGTMHDLYAESYAIRHPFQMIPSTGRYFWIPILSKWTPLATLAGFPDQLQAKAFSGAAKLRAHLNERYPATDRGEAWVVHLDGRVLIMNARENWDEEQTFDVSLGGDRRLSGKIGVNAYIMARESAAGQLQIQLNGRPGRTQTLRLGLPAQPSRISATPRKALVRSSWDAVGRCAVLEFSLSGPAIGVEVDAAAGDAVRDASTQPSGR